jgi:hypothetical protein
MVVIGQVAFTELVTASPQRLQPVAVKMLVVEQLVGAR